jgi:hypothetical protein
MRILPAKRLRDVAEAIGRGLAGSIDASPTRITLVKFQTSAMRLCALKIGYNTTLS